MEGQNESGAIEEEAKILRLMEEIENITKRQGWDYCCMIATRSKFHYSENGNFLTIKGMLMQTLLLLGENWAELKEKGDNNG